MWLEVSLREGVAAALADWLLESVDPKPPGLCLAFCLALCVEVMPTVGEGKEPGKVVHLEILQNHQMEDELMAEPLFLPFLKYSRLWYLSLEQYSFISSWKTEST